MAGTSGSSPAASGTISLTWSSNEAERNPARSSPARVMRRIEGLSSATRRTSSRRVLMGCRTFCSVYLSVVIVALEVWGESLVLGALQDVGGRPLQDRDDAALLGMVGVVLHHQGRAQRIAGADVLRQPAGGLRRGGLAFTDLAHPQHL